MCQIFWGSSLLIFMLMLMTNKKNCLTFIHNDVGSGWSLSDLTCVLTRVVTVQIGDHKLVHLSLPGNLKSPANMG